MRCTTPSAPAAVGTAAEVPAYTVLVAPTAAHQLTKRTPESVSAACVRFIYGPLAADPHQVGIPLRGAFDGYWVAERGAYRVHYRVDDETANVDVLDVSNRHEPFVGGSAH